MFAKWLADNVCVKAIVRGYHMYKDDWKSDIVDGFDCRLEKENLFDRYAIDVIVGWLGAVTAGCFSRPTNGALSILRRLLNITNCLTQVSK